MNGPLRIVTWNVNGIRAREAQVREWIGRERPDIVCLQEIKASPNQVPSLLFEMEGYACSWHCAGPHSGVALHVRRDTMSSRPEVSCPSFDFETRIVTARAESMLVASVYVPNGGKDFSAKMRFLAAMEQWVAEQHAAGVELVLCGDMNVTRSDLDVHPKERRPGVIGQRPDERAAFDRVLSAGLVDIGRALDPDNAELFTWWAPWRSHRQRNIGWRLDYFLASEPLAKRAVSCVVQAEIGTSDHAPVIATFV